MSLVTALALSPWRLSLQWLSWCAGLFFTLLSRAGVPPAGFVEQSKMREVQGILAHMHIREDEYRKALKELQVALDANEGDKKKALRCLKKTRQQLDALAGEVQQLHASGPADGAAPGSPAPAFSSSTSLHLSAAVLLLASWWFLQQDIPGLQRKLFTTLLFPLSYLYITKGLLDRTQCSSLMPICCACWFLVGFITAHVFST